MKRVTMKYPRIGHGTKTDSHCPLICIVIIEIAKALSTNGECLMNKRLTARQLTDYRREAVNDIQAATRRAKYKIKGLIAD